MTSSSSPITGATRLVGVIGDPVRHSKSPALLNAAFDAAGLDWRMFAMPVASGDAAAAVAGIRSLGIEGCSVTMPHKAAVIAHLDEVSARAVELDAVNCIRRDGDRLIGENTDGPGFVRGLADDTGFSPDGAACIVIGAGGAARAVIGALADAGASSVGVVNRTAERAEAAAAMAGAVGRIAAESDIPDAQLVVQATSVGMNDADACPVDEAVFRSHHVVADLIYHPAETVTMRAAAAHGATVANGLSMLLHQAAVAFTHWTGHEADTGAMRAAVQA